MNTITTTIVCTLIPVTTALAHEGGDVWIQHDGTSLFTGAIDEDGTPLSSSERVFGGEFGELPDPYLADEPGLQSLDGAFSPFFELRVDATDALRGWTGGGFDLVDETMTLSFGPQSFTTGAGPVPGFPFAMDDEGGFHGHFDLLLNGTGPGDPAPGVYLLALSLADTSGGLASSDPFYFVMNNGLSEEIHDEAIEWVETNLVPAPSVAMLGVLALVAGGRRRR